MSVFYEVTATIHDPAVAEACVGWMHGEHIAEIVAAGAKSGRLYRVEESPSVYVAHYEFASRPALDEYLTNHAPRLRAAGVQRFPPEKVILSRRVLIPSGRNDP